MEWMVVALLLNGTGEISSSLKTNIQFPTADECVENLSPISTKFFAVAEKSLRKSGAVKRGDKTPRTYKNIEWVCFPVAAQGNKK